MIRTLHIRLRRFGSVRLPVARRFGRRLPLRALRPLPTLLAILAPAFLLPGAVPALGAEGAAVPSNTTAASPSTEPSSSSSNTAPASTAPTSTTTAPVTTETSTASVPAPAVKTATPQAPSVGGRSKRHAKATPGGGASTGEGGAGGTETGGTGGTTPIKGHAAPPPGLTPLPPFALGSSLGGVPEFFIANFPLPAFLLPIYQAAGRAYDVPWQVLAAINEVETDYGRDLSLSSAGAEGWMQFLPSSWAQYGVDANGDGYADPYNPADAIFAAARYLKAAGGAHDIRAAIFAYNHSQSYVASVLLRAQLLRGTPPQLLGAIANLAEGRFPVHAPARFADGFPTVPGHPNRPLVATTIESAPGAPAIAVQDGTIAAIGRSAALGRYVVLRDAYGDTYTYGRLGSVATLYPVLTPHTPVRARRLALVAANRRHDGTSIPPASAGAQPRSPMSAAAVSSGLALGAATALEAGPVPTIPTPLLASRAHRPHPVSVAFRAGHEDVTLHPLQVGAHVIAGTVIGHLGPATEGATSTIAPPSGASGPGTGAPAGEGNAATAAGASVVDSTGPQARMTFQIRPGGVGETPIDPKPFLDSWVRLEGSLIYRAVGKHRFPAAPKPSSPSRLSPKTAASLASASTPTLPPGQWLALMMRLGAIPDPVVAPGHSTASIPTTTTMTTGRSGKANGNH